jgi:NAD-dependent dihydropyrimidine dehydrogenase PreA subunit
MPEKGVTKGGPTGARYLIQKGIPGISKDGVTMAIIINEDDCTACGACAETCPVGSITVEDVAICDDECVECGACIDECPNGAISLP